MLDLTLEVILVLLDDQARIGGLLLVLKPEVFSCGVFLRNLFLDPLRELLGVATHSTGSKGGLLL